MEDYKSSKSLQFIFPAMYLFKNNYYQVFIFNFLIDGFKILRLSIPNTM